MARGRQAPTPTAETIDRERKVLELRRAGVTFDVIALREGYRDRGGAYKAYRRALQRTLQEPADELRELEVDRLDRLLMAVWPLAMGGDLRAVDRVLRIAERRARLLGLDAPQRAVIDVPPEAQDVDQEAAAVAAQVLTLIPGLGGARSA